MSEVPEESSGREEVKAQVRQAVEELKAEVTTWLDQKLDELGAQI